MFSILLYIAKIGVKLVVYKDNILFFYQLCL